MNINLTSTDNMVGEYLIYRGFTNTYQSLELEKTKDRTKRFEVSKIVDNIFTNLHNDNIEGFITLWDFLTKRFFFHLNTENLNLCNVLKIDLIKFYLIHAIKSKNKSKITDFFSNYSHEILAESASIVPGSLRNWFVLPYLEEPEKDIEFSAYFQSNWCELLKIALHNFLSVVLSSAPPPKLILLEKWFRSEAQQEIRAELKISSKKIDSLLTRIEYQESRLSVLRELIMDVSNKLQEIVLSTNYNVNYSNNNINNNNRLSVNLHNFDINEIEEKKLKIKESCILLSEAFVHCLDKSTHLKQMSYEERMVEILGPACCAVVLKLEAYRDSPQIAVTTVDTSLVADPESTTTTNITNIDNKYNHYVPLPQQQKGNGEITNISMETMEQLEIKLIKAVRDWLYNI